LGKSDRLFAIVIVIGKSRRRRRYAWVFSPVLDKPDSSRLFTEALSAQVETVLADKTSLVGAEAALAASLSVLARAREPNGVVGHFVEGF